MKIFYCDGCGGLIFFESVQCVQCGRKLGFLPDALDASALEPEGRAWRALSPAANGRLYRECANGTRHQVCNWLVPAEDPTDLCVACRLNKEIPNLADPSSLPLWHKLELAKRRIVYSLLLLQLPVEGESPKGHELLRFSFLRDSPGSAPVMTGHADGLITINAIEADDAERERRRANLREPFRTLLGHLRHEIAHYYWDVLIANSPWEKGFREVFGDERADYALALKKYYAEGPPPDWQNRFVSAYAAAHPWEDWAETWAHYLHIVDTLETAAAFGMRLKPREHPAAKTMTSQPEQAQPLEGSFSSILVNWIPLTYALNTLNRGMGLPDLYPFVLSTPAMGKLQFVHDVIRSLKGNTPSSQ